MADISNIIDLDCEQQVVYTGVSDCPFNPGLPKFFAAIPRGKTYTQAEWDDIVNILAAAATENPFSTRVLPIGPIITMTDNSEEAVTENTDYGVILDVREGTIIWTVRFGYGLGEHLQMKNLAGKHNSYDFLIGFATGIAGTTRRDAVTGDIQYGGFRFSYIGVLNPKFRTGTTKENYSMTIQIADSEQLTKRMTFKTLDTVDISDVPGVQEVIMSGTVNASPAGSVDIAPLIKFGGKSLVEIYGGDVADITLFDATNFLTGNVITLTGATIVAGKIRLQADTTDPDYPAAAAKWTITPAPIADWVAAGIVGYEISNTVTVTRP
jgi:hypothetical protein